MQARTGEWARNRWPGRAHQLAACSRAHLKSPSCCRFCFRLSKKATGGAERATGGVADKQGRAAGATCTLAAAKSSETPPRTSRSRAKIGPIGKNVVELLIDPASRPCNKCLITAVCPVCKDPDTVFAPLGHPGHPCLFRPSPTSQGEAHYTASSEGPPLVTRDVSHTTTQRAPDRTEADVTRLI